MTTPTYAKDISIISYVHEIEFVSQCTFAFVNEQLITDLPSCLSKNSCGPLLISVTYKTIRTGVA